MPQTSSERPPLVDVTIAVHSATRPIARAVASVVDHTAAPVRVTVVAHNIEPEIIRRNLGAYADHPSVRLLSLADGVPSPAGPMNLGMEQATARFHSLLGSDDELAPGAIDSWLALQHDTGADVVLAAIRLEDGRTDPYPPVRCGRRTRGLDPVRDRLHYRSAPLGLVDRTRFGALRLDEGLRSGEDLAYCATLWQESASIAYDLTGPAYVTHADADDRVTRAPRPVADDFAFLDAVERSDWYAWADAAAKTAFTVKVLRIHVFDALAARIVDTTPLPDAARTATEMIAVIDRLLAGAPGALRLLSRADRAVLDALRAASLSPADVHRLLTARRTYATPAAILPRNLLFALHRQAPFRTLLAGLLAGRRGGSA